MKSLLVQGQIVKGFQVLQDISKEALSAEDRQLQAFTMAFLSQELGHASEVHALLSKDGDPLRKGYRHFLSGEAFYELEKYQQAAKEFEQVVSMKPAKDILYKTYFKLAQIAMKKKQWKRAYRHLRLIEKKWKNTHRHPQVIWDLVKVQIRRKKDPCPWVRKMYSRYPAHSLVYDWNIQLEEVTYEEQPLRCRTRSKSQAQRVRRLQWSGESERARREIEGLRQQSTPSERHKVDLMLATFLIDEGDIEEAIKILTLGYKGKKTDLGYLVLLGKAFSKAGDYKRAVNTYYQAYQHSPKNSIGQEALFSAAFLSYQFQDYNRASKKFQEFIKKYRTSKLKEMPSTTLHGYNTSKAITGMPFKNLTTF